jgi:DnaK suppressor protein
VDDKRAHELLAAERARIEEALREAAIEPNDELSTTEMADDATDTYQNEFDQGRMDDLRDQLAAVARAEERRREGTYGRSVESGKPIPDERLEVNPTAERTVEEEEALRRRGG